MGGCGHNIYNGWMWVQTYIMACGEDTDTDIFCGVGVGCGHRHVLWCADGCGHRHIQWGGCGYRHISWCMGWIWTQTCITVHGLDVDIDMYHGVRVNVDTDVSWNGSWM